MQKLFSFSKNQASILITLVILIALGACYFFLYLPNNEKAVQERRFRCLRKIDRGVRQKIETSEKQITGLINDYCKYSHNNQGKDLEKLKQYVTRYPRTNFILLLPEQANQYANAGHITYLGDDTSGNRFYIDADSRITLFVNRPEDEKKPDSAGAKGNLSGITIAIQFEYDQFVKPLLLRDVFSSYIVFINKHKIYEDYPTGLNDDEPDSLLNKKNQLTTPGVHSLQIGETDYKVFSHPAYTYANSKWIITGLLKNTDYQQEKDQLPLWVLLLLMTILVTMLVSLPWIKLYHMGNKDRLTINDAIASVLVSIVLMSLLFFVLFKYCIDIKQDLLPYPSTKTKNHVSYPSDTYSRNVLASKINDAFTGELNLACTLLDSFKATHTSKDTDVRLLRKSKTRYGALLSKYAPDLDVKEVFWLDGNANEQTNLTVDSNNDPKGNYRDRAYFNQAGKYTLGSHKFYLDQIYSYTNGIYRSVISMRAKKTGKDSAVAVGKDSVIAMSLNLKSFDKVVIPDGYQFGIISRGGWVLYHSIPNRNLLDNLQQEFVDDKDLLSSIEANSDTSFKAEYYGKQYCIKIKPVPGLPYYTVIFEDLEYNDIRDTEAYTFTVCMLIGMIFFLAIKYFIVFLVSSRHSSFKKQRFETSWVGPHVSAHHQYNLAIIANLFVILILIIFFNLCSFLSYLYLVLVSVMLTSIFLNVFFAAKYRNTDQYKYKFKIKTIVWLSAIIVLLDISASFSLTGKHFIFLVLYEVVLMAIFPLISMLSSRSLLKLHQFKAKYRIAWTFARSYALMSTTRLVISSGIPAAFFFIYSFNYEQNLDTRYRQLSFAGALQNKINISGKNFTADNRKLDSIMNNHICTSGIYADGFFINRVRIDSGKKFTDSVRRISKYTHEDMLTAQLLSAFRLKTDNVEIRSNNLNLSSGGNNVFFSKLNKRSGDNSPVNTFYQINPSSYFKMSSLSHVNYETPDVIFWVLLITSVLLFYFVVHHVTRKLFSLNMLPTKNWGAMDGELLENNEFNSMALLVGSPGANTLQKLTDKISRQKILSADGNPLSLNNANQLKYNAFIADLMIISAENGEADPDWKRHKKAILAGHGLVIINHFEYNIKDVGVSKIKLDLLESLLEQKTSKVIIISTMHPLIFLDSFSGQQPDPAFESQMSRWYVLLGNFHVLIDPLIGSIIPKDAQMLKRAVTEETRYSRFLHGMQKISLKYLDKGIHTGVLGEEMKEQLADSIIFKLQLTSQYFYTDIWQSLTHEERFLLYDLAEDGFVNSFDDFNLSMLICKGLIINNDGALILFNRGFRNFILTAIGEKEMERIKEQVKDNGKWGNLKVPLNLAIVAILAFLFASQQESYSRIITYITAFSAGIPAVLKIFSLFGTSGPQKTG